MEPHRLTPPLQRRLVIAVHVVGECEVHGDVEAEPVVLGEAPCVAERGDCTLPIPGLVEVGAEHVISQRIMRIDFDRPTAHLRAFGGLLLEVPEEGSLGAQGDVVIGIQPQCEFEVTESPVNRPDGMS